MGIKAVHTHRINVTAFQKDDNKMNFFWTQLECTTFHGDVLRQPLNVVFRKLFSCNAIIGVEHNNIIRPAKMDEHNA